MRHMSLQWCKGLSSAHRGLQKGLRTLSRRREALRKPVQGKLNVADLQAQLQGVVPVSNIDEMLSAAQNQVPPAQTADQFDAKMIESMLHTSRPEELGPAFWSVVRALARNPRAQGHYIQLFCVLFEVAKEDTNPKRRLHMLRIIGNYIYAARRVRLDPINEVEYLDALVASGRVFRAIELWKSRVGRPDVAGSIYWPEIGALYYLDAGLPQTAHTIAIGMDYVPPRLVVALIQVMASRRNPELQHWVNYLVSSPLGEDVTDFEDAQSVEQKLHSRPATTREHLRVALNALVRYQRWPEAALLADKVSPSAAALAASTRPSRGRSEASIMDFFETLVAKIPSIVESPELISALLASFGRRGERDEFWGILDEADSRCIPIRYAARIVAILLSNPDTAAMGHQVARRINTPSVAVVLARHLKGTDRDQFLATLDAGSPSLALEILKAGNPGRLPLTSLGKSQRCWRYIWYHVATTQHGQIRELIQEMIRSGTDLTVNMVESVIQAALVRGDPVAAAGMLEYMGRVPPILAESVFQATRTPRRATKPSPIEIQFPETGLAPSQVISKMEHITGMRLGPDARILATELASAQITSSGTA